MGRMPKGGGSSKCDGNGRLPHHHLAVSLRHGRYKLMGMVGRFGSVVWISVFFSIMTWLYWRVDVRHQQQLPPLYGEVWDLPTITIYAAPQPFDSATPDLVRARQELAVRSWAALSPAVDVVLFGKHPSILAFAKALGPQVTVESYIDFTFLGTPFFHSMVARSEASNSSISVLVDPETIILPDILTTLHDLSKSDRDWFLVSMSQNISHFPYHVADDGKHWLQEDGTKIEAKELQELLIHKWQQRSCNDRLLIAWNTGDLPLHAGVLPPFVYGKGFHNEWLINEVLWSELRFVVDVSEVISSFYPENLRQWSNETSKEKDSDSGAGGKLECRANHNLATLYGSLFFQQDDNLHYNWAKLVKCLGRHYLIKQATMSSVNSLQGPDGIASYVSEMVPGEEEGSLQLLTTLLHSGRRNIRRSCVKDIKSLNGDNQCSIMKLLQVPSEMPAPVSFPFSLESLLPIVADKDKTVVLAVAGESYRDMLMSWVCRLRLLGVSNFIVCALDSEIFQFSVLQGLPVFRDQLAPSNISFNDCHFGTECFQRVTKVKSRIVLQILKLGYHVLLSDVDVYWFENPLPYLLSFGPAALVAQSDEHNQTGAINLPRRLNSGFYFARADLATTAALEMVVKHASTSGLSEQPSFYDVLCGEGGVNRVGDDQCREPNTNLTVFFLDRNLFPNGAYKALWEEHDVRSACQELGCVILHNNWISGRQRKLERQMHSGLWEYDPSSRLCLQSWYRGRSMSYISG